ncbi:MAG: alpha/beta hydrolase fold domain-containing protein [Sutterella sp.]
MTLSQHFRLAGMATMLSALLAVPAVEAADKPFGYTEGADIITVPVSDGRIDTISGVIFHQAKSLRAIDQLCMTVMVPRTTAPKPAVIYFPGGGFTSADHEKFIEMRYALARAGFAVAAAEYRPVPTKFPGLIEDGKAAVRFLRAHAKEWGVDPNKIGVLGDSAGGYLVEMLGTTNGEKGWDKGDWTDVSSDVQAVVSLYGLSDLLNIGEGLGEAQEKVHASPAVTEALLVNGPAFRDFPGASIHSDKKKALNASAIGHVDGTEPPFLLLHGSNDRLVSPMQSAHLFEALKAKKVDAQYVLVEGAQHGDLPWYQAPLIERVVSFFKAKLGEPQKAGENKGGNL